MSTVKESTAKQTTRDAIEELGSNNMSETMTSPGVEAQQNDVASPLQLRAVTKHFKRPNGDLVPAIDGVDLEVEPGEFVVLLGPSGCGKTTLLRSIAGLELPDSGYIASHGVPLYDSNNVIEVAPERRGLGMVFQSYALFPHLSVESNVGYPMRHGSRSKGQKSPLKSEIKEAVDKACRMVGIEDLTRQFPNQISGGQQQRVALARALVDGRDVILFDEPLSNVDARVREHLRSELKMMHAKLKFTAVYVTHDQVEAMELADRVVVMQKGKIAQQGSPVSVYREPKTLYVARFLGLTNDIAADVVSSSPTELVVNSTLGQIVGRKADDYTQGDKVRVVMRPESLKIGVAAASVNRWPATVISHGFLGAHTEYIVEFENGHAATIRGELNLAEIGDTITVSIDPSDVYVVPDEAA